MKKFLKWIKAPESDFALFVIFLILLNLVANNAFFRLDLTSPKSYSLSSSSSQIVKNLNEPLSVQVFFSENLPAPYNSVEQYVKDILVEYKGNANSNFSYHIYNMNDPENQELASDYGLRQIQIQEIANNEVGFKQAWMGVAVIYADAIQTIDGLTSSDGFEYKLTTTISKMISTADTLALLPKDDKIKLTLYVSDELKDFRISGFDQVEETVRSSFTDFAKRNQDRIEFEKITPAKTEINSLAEKYGTQVINWTERDGSEGLGILGLVLEHGDNFRLIPLSMQRSLFGFAIVGLDNLEDSLNQALQSLVSNVMEIGYVTGHGEPDLADTQAGAGLLDKMVSDIYSFTELNLTENDIPVNLNAILINGPKSEFSEIELYKIDQFIMRGGNVMFFTDSFQAQQNQMYYGQAPTYTPVETGLEKLLNAYGVKIGKDVILDENCFEQMNQSMGKIPLYFAPLLQKKGLANHPITKNLGYVIFLQNSSIDISEAEKNADVKITKLAESSKNSWLQTENVDFNPLNMYPPSDKTKEKSENLMVLLEGKFNSAFENEVVAENVENSENGINSAESEIRSENHLKKSTRAGKILVSGTAQILTPQLIDENGTEPMAMLVRNAVDYMNGNEDLCTMRTKGLSLNFMSVKNAALANVAKLFNQFGLAVLVALVGLIVWKKRSMRRDSIRRKYNPDDERTSSRSAKKSEEKSETEEK